MIFTGKQQICNRESFCYFLSNYFELLLFADEDDIYLCVDLLVPPDPWSALLGQHSSYKETLLPPGEAEGGPHQHHQGGE